MVDKKIQRRNRQSKNRARAQERAFARFILAERRTPLSGGMSGHTRADVIDKEIYAECKGAKSTNSSNGWMLRWLSEVPSLRSWWCLSPLGILYAQHVKRLEAVKPVDSNTFKVWDVLDKDMPKPGCALWRDTVEKAAKESKLPVLGLRLYGKQGWWLVGQEPVMNMLHDRGRCGKEEA